MFQNSSAIKQINDLIFSEIIAYLQIPHVRFVTDLHDTLSVQVYNTITEVFTVNTLVSKHNHF